MSDTLEVVYTAVGHLEADRIKSWLEAEGIPAMVSQEGVGTVYGLTVGIVGEADILVPAARAAEAKALIAALLAGDLEKDAVEPDTPLEPPAA